jgi:hypothetical protein
VVEKIICAAKIIKYTVSKNAFYGCKGLEDPAKPVLTVLCEVLV